MFSAYDLKKIIPRAIFALIAVNLSWSLIESFIKAVELLGLGAKEMITAPFGELGQMHLGSGEASFALIGAGAGLAAAAAGIIPILGVAITGLFGLLFAFGILLLRKVFLIGLVVISPVAIALSIFPQTENWAKKWWDWFSKLLLMYPFITAMFGLSQVASGILSQISSNPVEKMIYTLASIIIMIIPYFLVGKALSLAGGAIGRVAGMVNNKDRGIIDKTKKWEQKRVGENRYDLARGQRYDGKNRISKGVNTLGRSIRHPIRTVARGEAARDAEIMRLINEGAATQEERHPGAKNLTKDQNIAVAVGDSKERVEAEARRRATADTSGRNKDEVFREERAKLETDYRTAKAALGGSVDASAQLYAVQKAMAEGSISGETAAASVEDIAARSATSEAQQVRLARKFAAELDTKTGDKQSVLESSRVTANLTGAPPVSNIRINTDVNGVFQGPKAASRERLTELSKEDIATIGSSKTNQTVGALRSVEVATTPKLAQQALNEVTSHRSHLVRAREAAATAGKTTTAASFDEALENIDREIQAHIDRVASGVAPNPSGAVINLDAIRTQSAQQAAQYTPATRPTP